MYRFFQSLSFKTILLLSVLATLFCLFLLGQKNFSMDELESLYYTKDWLVFLHNIKDIEGNMWLYYLLIHFWQILDHSETFIRLLSVIFAVASIPFVYLIGKSLFNSRVAFLSSIFILLNVFFIQNAQNARSYSLELFLTTLSSYVFIKYALSNSKYLYLMAIINTLAVYSHLYAIFVIGVQFLSVFFLVKKKNWKIIFISFTLTGIFILPLFLAPSFRSGQINWIARPDIKNLIGTFIILSNDFLPISGLYILLFLSYVVSFLRSKKKKKDKFHIPNHIFLLLWIVFPIFTSFIFSLFIKPMYISAYFLICVVPFTLLVSQCLDSIKSRSLRLTLIIILIGLSLLRLFGWYTESKSLGLVIRNYNEDWGKTAIYLATHTQPTDAVLFLPLPIQGDAQRKVNFYIEQQHYSPLTNEISLQSDVINTESSSYHLDIEQLFMLPKKYSTVWYVLQTVTDSTVDSNHRVISGILSDNYTLSDVVNFKAMTIYKYKR